MSRADAMRAMSWLNVSHDEWASLCNGKEAYGDMAPAMLSAAVAREMNLLTRIKELESGHASSNEGTAKCKEDVVGGAAQGEQDVVTVDAVAWEGFIRDYERYSEGDPKMPFRELRESLAVVIESARASSAQIQEQPPTVPAEASSQNGPDAGLKGGDK